MKANIFLFIIILALAPGSLIWAQGSDKELIDTFLREVRLDYGASESETIPDEETIDQNLEDDGISLLEGMIFHAPDKAFSILMVEGEGCGAYCNPFWESVILMKDGKRIDSNFLTPVQSIHALPHNYYLIIQNSYGRPAGYYTVESYTANLVSIKEGELKFHTCISGEGDTNQFGKGSFGITQEFTVPREIHMNYDPENLEIRYQYGTDFSIYEDVDSMMFYQGKLKFETDGFREVERKEELIPKEEYPED